MDKTILAYMNNEKTAVQDIATFQSILFDEFCREDEKPYFCWLECLFSGRYPGKDAYDRPDVKRMNYIDLYAMLHEYKKLVPNIDEKAFEMLFARNMTQHLLKSQYHDGRIRLFLATPLKLFFKTLGRQAAKSYTDESYVEESDIMDWSEVLADDVIVADRYHKHEERTDSIGEMLKKAVLLSTDAWRPSRGPLEEYGEKIEAAYRIILDLLLYPFQEAYPERYGEKIVRKRLQHLTGNHNLCECDGVWYTCRE